MHQCPCCDYYTLKDWGAYSICPVCFWENDGLDIDEPDAYSGPNHMTLREARQKFLEFGACEERFVEKVVSVEQRKRYRYEGRSV